MVKVLTHKRPLSEGNPFACGPIGPPKPNTENVLGPVGPKPQPAVVKWKQTRIKLEPKVIKQEEGRPRTKAEKPKIKREKWVFSHPYNEGNPQYRVPHTGSVDKRGRRLCKKLARKCDKFVFQLEHGDLQHGRGTQRQVHWSGYFELKGEPQNVDWIRTHIGPFEYVAPAKRSPTQCWNHCSKRDTQLRGPWCLGEPNTKKET